MGHRLFKLLTISSTLLALIATGAAAKIQVVTTTQDLADIARTVGGNKVSVTGIAPGNADPHYVEPRPSMVNSLRNADVLVKIGLDQDIWIQGLIDAARNRKIVAGAPGHIDASRGIKVLEIPTEKLDPSMGHIHIHGNPHYWLDPMNGKIVAKNIAAGLSKLSPADASYFEQNSNEFAKALDAAMVRWQKAMAPHKGTQVVTYHKSFVYFLNRFGLKTFDQVEPKPGIPPSPSHINSLIAKMKNSNVKVIMMEVYYPRKSPDLVAKQAGGQVVVVPSSVNAVKGADSYIKMFDEMINRLTTALK